MKIFIITGESSGDLLGAPLVKALFKRDPGIQISGWGGTQMKNAGVTILQDIENMQFMGFWEVFKNLFLFYKLLKLCRKHIREFNPDIIIFIDYGGFNLKMAEWSKNAGFTTVYYVPPKVWASREGRLEKLKKYIDLIIVSYPFEQAYFQSRGMAVKYFGNSLVNTIQSFKSDPDFRQKNQLDDKPLGALLPGSRRQEVKYILPVLCAFARKHPGYNWCIAQAPQLSVDDLLRYIPEDLKTSLHIIQDDTYNLFAYADFAILASGTASVEAALFRVPQIVCYKTHWINFQLARRLIKVPFLSWVNLIHNRSVVKELIQDQLTEERLALAFKEAGEKNQLKMAKVAYDQIIAGLKGESPEESMATAILNLK